MGGEDVCTYSKTAPSLTDKQAADKDRSRPLTLEALGNIAPPSCKDSLFQRVCLLIFSLCSFGIVKMVNL